MDRRLSIAFRKPNLQRDLGTLKRGLVQPILKAMRTVEHLLEETRLSIEELAQRAGLPADRVAAIAEGRWTPTPADRARIAAAFGVPVAEVSWGHTMNPRNVRYGRFGLKE